MIVTDKEYYLDGYLVGKLDLMVKRLKGADDCVIVIDGDEGMGKTNMASALCYYIAYNLNRKYNVDNIFFFLDDMLKFAAETKEQIIHWDEAALGGLSVHWWKENQGKLLQLFMTARKKKHFIVMCIPKFNYLREYFFLDRSIGLINVYARQNIHKGNFYYFTKRKKEMLYEYWKRKRIRNYVMFKTFKGRFTIAMKKIFTEEELDAYENKKDKAILSIAQAPTNQSKKEDKLLKQTEELKTKIAHIHGIVPGLTQEIVAKHMGWHRDTLCSIKRRAKEKGITLNSTKEQEIYAV